MTRKGWYNVKCDECGNRQDFPTPRPSWICNDCLPKPPPQPAAPPRPSK
jgi:hypothetical protein